jgi:integrase
MRPTIDLILGYPPTTIQESIEMSISKRTWTTPSGETRTAWAVRYRDADKKYRLKTFARLQEARAWEAETKVEIKKGAHRPFSTSPTIRYAAELWLKRARDLTLEPRSIDGYESRVRLHINPAIAEPGAPNGWSGPLGDIRLAQVTTPLCRNFVRCVMSKNSRDLAQKVLVSFKGILKEAMEQGLIAFNPAQPVCVPIDGRDKPPIRIGEQIPSKEDIRAILTASERRWHPLFFVAAFTGMRSSELRALPWTNVDLDHNLIKVRQRADEPGEIGRCKSRAGFRDIQISDAVVTELRMWRPYCRESELGLVFPNGVGKVIQHASILRDGWFSVQKRIGMVRPNKKPKYKFHSLRHFYASIMIEQRAPAKRLQDLLGHASIKMTMDTYGHLFPPGEDDTQRINGAVESVLALPGAEELEVPDAKVFYLMRHHVRPGARTRAPA